MYLPTIMQDGKTLLIEADHIKDIQLMQPLNIGSDHVCYIVIINYDNDTPREQAVITDDTWKWWNEERRNHADNNK